MTFVEVEPSLAAKRREWDPSRTDLVSEIVDALVQKYKDGQLRDELRPKTLRDLGDPFEQFYFAAFRRQDRSPWSITRFPQGFDSLVKDVNERLAQAGISISNTKAEVALYRKLPQDQLIVVKIYSEQFKAGEIELAAALDEMKNLHGIVLSGGQQRAHFSVQKAPSSESDAARNLEKTKGELAQRVEELRKELKLDLAIEQCLRGLLFEAFVGTALAHRFGAQNVASQVERGVAYRDLNGTPHGRVYLDFLVTDGDEREIFEAKLRNSFENIITSVLPQLMALERETGRKGEITVIYRHPCPLMRAAMDHNISLGEEAQCMGLNGLNSPGRKIRDLLRYRSIEDFLSADPLGDRFMNALRKIENGLTGESLERLREYTDALLRTASGDRILEKVERIAEWAAEKRPIQRDEQRRFFGESPTASYETSEGRIITIQRSLLSRRDQLLLAIYNLHSKSSQEVLTPDTIKELEALPLETFRLLALEVLAVREERYMDRILKRRHVETEESQVIDSFDRMERRRRADKTALLARVNDELGKACDGYFEPIKKDPPPTIQASKIVISYDELREGLRRVKRLNRWDLQRITETFNDLGAWRDKCVRDTNLILVRSFANMHAALKSEYTPAVALGNSGWIDFRPVEEMFRDLENRISRSVSEVQSDKTVQFLLQNAERTKLAPGLFPHKVTEFLSDAKNRIRCGYLPEALGGVHAVSKALVELGDKSPTEACWFALSLCSAVEGADSAHAILLRLLGNAASMITNPLHRTLYGIHNDGLLLEATRNSDEPENLGEYLATAFQQTRRTTIELKKFESSRDDFSGIPDFKHRISQYCEHEIWRDWRGDFANKAVVIQNLIQNSRAQHLDCPDYLVYRIMMNSGISQTAADGKFEMGGLFEAHAQLVWGLLKEWGLAGEHLLLDLASRQIRQAQILAYFGDDMAASFIEQYAQFRWPALSDYDTIVRMVRARRAESDAAFEGLMGK